MWGDWWEKTVLRWRGCRLIFLESVLSTVYFFGVAIVVHPLTTELPSTMELPLTSHWLYISRLFRDYVMRSKRAQHRKIF